MRRSFLLISGMVFLSLPAAMQAGCGASEGRLVSKSDSGAANTPGTGGKAGTGGTESDDAALPNSEGGGICKDDYQPCSATRECCRGECDYICVPGGFPEGGFPGSGGSSEADAGAPDGIGGGNPGCKQLGEPCDPGQCCAGTCAPMLNTCVNSDYDLAACQYPAEPYDEFFEGAMVGCMGTWGWSEVKDTLCGLGSHVCTVEEWISRHEGRAPNHNYWVMDPLPYSTGEYGNCTAKRDFTPGSTACPEYEHAHVCMDNQGNCAKPDPSGNRCCPSNCSLGENQPNNYLGGCGENSSTAGVLCCSSDW